MATVRFSQQKDQIKKTWSIIPVGKNNPISLRAIWPRGIEPSKHPINRTFGAAAYPDVADRKSAFEAEALSLNGWGYNVYIVMNPIKSTFAGDETNGIAVRDSDIECRALLLIDIDRAHAVEPIHEDEIDDVMAFAFEIEEYFVQTYDVERIAVFSGNGVHNYLPLDNLPNDDSSKVLCHSVLQGLAHKFDDDTYKVDTSVYNAARITKVPGTIARKGVESEERPYQIAAVIE